ncbi:MAG TPA: Nramp family divalent metal transporter [Candidatus Limnocylindrales bacterium]|jgi:Mn2+/Fe2+ NRAMP family transporter|nr:Nramp family divalent metal transporter [Candidatus Limnocylindrales bacterium]
MRLPAAPEGVRRRVRAAGSELGPLARFRERIAAGDLLRLRPRFRGRGLLAFLAVMGPGLIAGIAGNEAGGLTTYSVLGAETGFRLLWLFPLTTVVLMIVQEMAARLGVVTGQGLSDLIRDWFGVRWTAFAMLVLFVANLGQTIAEFAGIAAALEIFGLPRLLTVPLTAVALWALVLFASYRTVERVFLSVILVFVTYIVSAFVSGPDWGEVGRALVTPSFELAPATLLLMVALVGTTITPYMQFYLQSAVAEKGIDEEELRLEQADAVGGAIWTNVVALFVVVATAQTLHAAGVRITDAADAAQALGPVAGELSTALFAIGLFGASVLAAMILPISTSFVICEAFGWESGVGKPFREAPAFFGIYTVTLFAGAVIVLLPFLPPLIDVLLFTQNLQGLLLPIVLVFMFRLVNNERLLGRHVNGPIRNALTLAAIVLVVALDAILLGVGALEAIGLRLG